MASHHAYHVVQVLTGLHCLPLHSVSYHLAAWFTCFCHTAFFLLLEQATLIPVLDWLVFVRLQGSSPHITWCQLILEQHVFELWWVHWYVDFFFNSKYYSPTSLAGWIPGYGIANTKEPHTLRANSKLYVDFWASWGLALLILPPSPIIQGSTVYILGTLSFVCNVNCAHSYIRPYKFVFIFALCYNTLLENIPCWV